jgi:hypothetical protein
MAISWFSPYLEFTWNQQQLIFSPKDGEAKQWNSFLAPTISSMI